MQGAASDIQVSAMSDMTTSPEESSDRFFLQERELWESLEFDWKDWNATVEKILQQQSDESPQGQDQPSAPLTTAIIPAQAGTTGRI